MDTLDQSTDDAISQRLAKWRASKQWTQRQAADYLGAPLQTYQHWEQGHSVPRNAMRKALERAMGL